MAYWTKLHFILGTYFVPTVRSEHLFYIIEYGLFIIKLLIKNCHLFTVISMLLLKHLNSNCLKAAKFFLLISPAFSSHYIHTGKTDATWHYGLKDRLTSFDYKASSSTMNNHGLIVQSLVFSLEILFWNSQWQIFLKSNPIPQTWNMNWTAVWYCNRLFNLSLSQFPHL